MKLTDVRFKDDIPSWLVHNRMKKLCEVGVHQGRNLRKLLATGPTLMVAVDIWSDDGVQSHNDTGHPQERLDKYYADALSLRATNECLLVMREYSVKAAEVFPREHFDFVYIDADHTYEAVRDDVRAWWPKVRMGGVLSGHDYTKAHQPTQVPFGVIQAVDEFVAENPKCQFHTTKGFEAYPSWFLVKQ